ncbi:hypothetical protein PHYBLDRAFT_174813 [Phycomyces blakesleeanus NRRL 1555(-)]|uniref:Uncharacterized protein n=1 Tax=Phycomyces blakesleeanus (strain ATCC 8743b / DSM 1359 / FGSC 10004 / NBRC 33097 / NRRL 1555) TaxID=763407 RepID=A0A167JVW4_PHYB8|nr:hypothetical protein PHYBLDRAFT_174813 [Phycomyces blakesleeanus NRRL 1555(-)]OAD66789.1 hypothetical protein PHYBLDRAFT_174813 [Phycomyces blakesleeanus NRRL 1555(-)]|eukprot:XP_018284829.1 hypothetical protein PHYBLDRAFT_174813 [Phycomyces blakesleeanus NRRL 1555(-)]
MITLLLTMPRSKTNCSNKSNNSTSTNGYKSAEKILPSNAEELLDLMQQRIRVPSSAPIAAPPKRARTNNEDNSSESFHKIEDLYQKIVQMSTFLLSSDQNIASSAVATTANEAVKNILAIERIPTQLMRDYMFNDSLYSQYNRSETCCSDRNRQIIQSVITYLSNQSKAKNLLPSTLHKKVVVHIANKKSKENKSKEQKTIDNKSSWYRQRLAKDGSSLLPKKNTL